MSTQKTERVQNVINLPRVIGRFMDLYEAKRMESDPTSKPRFSYTAVLDPNDPKHLATYAEVEAEVKRVIAQRYPDGAPSKLIIDCYGKGNDKTNQKTGKVYAGFEGMLWVTAHAAEDSYEKGRWILLSTDRDEKGKFKTLPPNDARLYDGVRTNGKVQFYIPKDVPGRTPRVCCAIVGVQTLNYGTPMGGSLSEKDRDFSDFDADEGFEENDGPVDNDFNDGSGL